MSETLKVLGHDYEIIFGKEIADRSNIYGIHLPKTLKIFVDGSTPWTLSLETLWHEIHESIAYWNSMDIPHHVLSQFSANSMAVILNNPWLVKMIDRAIETKNINQIPEELDPEDYIIFEMYGKKQTEEECKLREERLNERDKI